MNLYKQIEELLEKAHELFPNGYEDGLRPNITLAHDGHMTLQIWAKKDNLINSYYIATEDGDYNLSIDEVLKQLKDYVDSI